MLVRVDGLFDLGIGENYALTGRTDPHPQNHFGKGVANIGMREIADDYRTRYYGTGPITDDQKIAYNDTSLEFGGKFDLKKCRTCKPDWMNNGSHDEHREGINNDTRSNNIPSGRRAALLEIFDARGSTRTGDETDNAIGPHWHLRFEFRVRQVAERTPHGFVEDAFGAALERESSQQEYESWLARITNAKAQGQTQLLAEAKAFELEIFDSAEYIARGRTDQEFIEDVFWSHLFREPTGQEAKDWLNVLQSINAITQQAQRMTFLYEFEGSSEFQSVVYGIVDPTAPPQPTPTPTP